MSLPSFEGLAEVTETLLADRGGSVLEARPPGRTRDVAPLATAADRLAATGAALGIGRLELLQVSGGSRATLAALRADALLVAAVGPGAGRAQVERSLRAWCAGAHASPAAPAQATPAALAPTAPSAQRPPAGDGVLAPVTAKVLAALSRTPPPAAAEPASGPAPRSGAPSARARLDPWAALRRALARGELGDVAALRRDLDRAPAPGGAGAEPLAGPELDRALHRLVEGIGGVLAGDGLGGARALAELAAPSQANLSLRWLALHWCVRGAIGAADYDGARDHAREALRIIPQLDVHARAVTQWTSAEVLAHKGDHVRALSWLGEARKRFESAREAWGLARAWMAEARILAAVGREADGVAAARAAAATDPAWEEPRLFLARRALARGDLAEASALLAHLQGPAAERTSTLLAAVRDGAASQDDASALLRERDLPPTPESIAAVRRIVERSPAFAQAREALAWMLLKVGRYAEAGTLLRALLEEPLGAADRASVMLGLGCIAHAEQAGPRGQAGTSGAGLAPPAPAPLTPTLSPQGGERGLAQSPSASGASGPLAQSPSASGFSGLLSVLSVPDVLEFLRGARRTGLLVCSSARGRAALRFSEGWITGLVPAPPGADDAAALARQVERTIRELVQWKDGEFSFGRDEEPAPGRLPVKVDVQGALLEAFRQLDEDARGAAAAREGSAACA